MGQASLLFIPDISGFTEFVKETEIEHSRHIISELLELLIDENELGMTLAEIEGDALFFYKHQDIPTQDQLLSQISRMFTRFHGHLKYYEKHRICHCGACRTATNLSLKFVIHAGDFQFIQVKEHKKPYGQCVITAHRLLKNEVPNSEYALFSNKLMQNWRGGEVSWEAKWMADSGISEYGDVGLIHYDYIPLERLHSEVPELPPQKPLVRGKHPLVEQIQIQRPVNDVYELISNLNHRHLWNEGPEDFLFQKDRVNRNGTKHYCVVNDRQLEFETVADTSNEEQQVYGEITSDFPLMRKVTNYFILEPDQDHTRVTAEVHFNPVPVLGWLAAPFAKRLFRKNLLKTIENIKQIAEGELAISH